MEGTPSLQLTVRRRPLSAGSCRGEHVDAVESAVRRGLISVLSFVGGPRVAAELTLSGYVNTATGRRAHTERRRVLSLYAIT